MDLRLAVQIFCFVLLLLSPAAINGYPQYRDQIPNGYNVPNPCNASVIWAGVGHKNPQGGGERNPFGLAFAANGHLWTQALCQADSDGDGKTNGQELGDPGCQWTAGGTFRPATTGLSHPGVCEPIGSPRCSSTNNSWIQCGAVNASCTAEFRKPGVQYIDVRMPNVSVSADYTMHRCFDVKFPDDKKYQIIGGEPLIENYANIHHILVLACSDGGIPPPTTNGTWDCPMPPCYQLVAGYGFGLSTFCFPEKFGIPFGAGTNVKHAIMQVHYTNMEHRAGIVDNSGIRIYYTANLRPNDGGVILAGPYYLAIPPHQPAYVQTGYCPHECTDLMAPTGSVNITDIYLHMHLTGVRMNVTLYRRGVPVKLLVSEAYNYDSPQRVTFSEEQIFYPGDELRVDCVFNTTDRTNYTYFGQSTSDEMCVAVPTYYPANPFLPICGQWKNYSVCNNYFVVPGCNMTAVLAILLTLQTTYQCNYLLGCREPCVASLVSRFADTGCLERDIPEFLVFALQTYSTSAKQLVELMTYCYGLSRTTPTPTVLPPTAGCPSASQIDACRRYIEKCVLKCLQFRRCFARENCVRKCTSCLE